jgi:hypothetical protein
MKLWDRQFKWRWESVKHDTSSSYLSEGFDQEICVKIKAEKMEDCYIKFPVLDHEVGISVITVFSHSLFMKITAFWDCVIIVLL